MSTRNFYEILNSQSNASYEELKENYKQLILQCHPDKLLQDINAHKDTNSTTTATATATMKAEAGNAFVNDVQENNKTDSKDCADIVDDGDLNAKSDRKFVAINEAWNTLKDPTKRKLYDAEMLLTKFQTHSNVFERLTLADMEKHSGNNTINLANTNQSNDNDNDVDVDVDVDENGISTSDTYYTYDCRCGGQYIVDESADNEIFNHKRSDCEVIVECNECSLVVILNG